MVRNFKLTDHIDTRTECPSLDPSFSSADSETSSPSSFIQHGSSIHHANPWLDGRDPSWTSPQSAVSQLPTHAHLPSDIDLLADQDNYPCAEVPMGPGIFASESDCGDAHHLPTKHDMGTFAINLDYTGYNLAGPEATFLQTVSASLEMDSVDQTVPLAAYNQEPTQHFDWADFNGAHSVYPFHTRADRYTPTPFEDIPQTVVPSQTVTEPITPSSSMDASFKRSPSEEGSPSPMSLLPDYESLLGSSPISAARAKRTTGRLNFSTLRTGFDGTGQLPTQPSQASRTFKREQGLMFNTSVIPRKQHRCLYPKCNEPGLGPKSFNRLEHLKRHEIQVHLNDKPFACQYCKQLCARGDNYRQHLRTHTRKGGRNQYFPEAEKLVQEMERAKELKRARKMRRAKL